MTNESPARETDSRLPESVRIVEVGPRDGFQMEATFLPTELKIATLERLADAGLRDIEAVSFVHPKVIPQMRDADEVMAGLSRREGVRYWALVPNLRGAERALAAEVSGVHFVIAATETYNRRNVGMSVEESISSLRTIVEETAGRVPVAATLAVTFGCPFEGQLPDERLEELAQRLGDTGIEQLGLADTAGLGDPVLVRRIVRRVLAALPGMPLRLHLHDTRGLGMANAWVGLEEGVEIFDTSFGGLGGCPIMVGASGNLATEDFTNLCREVGIATGSGPGVAGGVDLDGVREAARTVAQFLGREPVSRLVAAGTRDELYARNAGAAEPADP